MPLDPSIILGVRQPDNPLDSISRAISLRALMEQRAQDRQLNALNLQEGNLKLRQANRAEADDLATRQIYMNAAQGTPAIEPGSPGAPGPAPRSAPPGTPSPMAIAARTSAQLRAKGLYKQADAIDAQAFKNAEVLSISNKNNAESANFNSQAAKRAVEQFGSATGAILALAPERRAAAWDQTRAALLATPGVSPAEIPEQYPGDEWLRVHHDKALSVQDQVSNHIKEADQARAAAEEERKKQKFPSELAKSEAEAATKKIEANQMGSLGMTKQQQDELNRQTKANEETARHNKKDEALSGGRLAVEKARYGFESSGGISAAAQMAAEGKMDPSTLRSILRSNPGLINQIKAVDPNFDTADIDRRFGTLKEFNSTSNGKAGGQALALNTLIHHADLFMQAGEALRNGSFKPGNAAYNAISTAMGRPAPQNAALVARFLAGETGKVATGGVPAEGEINGVLKSLGTDSSPDQIRDAGQTILQIAAGRATPLMERVKESKLDAVVKVLGADAKEILGRRGFDPDTMKRRDTPAGTVVVTDPRGVKHNFPNQAAADAFKKAAGL